MTQAPKVSVVIPTFNYGHFIFDAVRSVLNQTFQDFELLIIDNCSSDDTAGIVAGFQYDARVKYIRNDVNLGMVGNFNRCIEMAAGKYIKFLMADDRLNENILQKFVEVLDRHEDIVLVTSDTQSFGAESKVRSSGLQYMVPGKQAIREALTNGRGNFIGEPSSVMIRKQTASLVRFDNRYSCTTDIDCWLRILTKGDLYVVPEVLSYFRVHSSQASASSNFQNWFDEYFFYKQARKTNPYNVDFEGLGIDRQIKKTAIKSAMATFVLLRNFWSKNNTKLMTRSIRIGLQEGVLISSFRIFLRENRKRKQLLS